MLIYSLFDLDDTLIWSKLFHPTDVRVLELSINITTLSIQAAAGITMSHDGSPVASHVRALVKKN